MRDIASNLNFRPAFGPKAAISDNTPFVSTVLDRFGYESVCLALVTGVEADADATFAVLLEESDFVDMSGANAVSDDDLVGTEAAAGFDFSSDTVCRKLGYVGSKQFIRATVTPSANGAAAFLAGIWVLGGSRTLPTANPPQ